MVAALIHTINEEFGLFTFATMSTYFSIAGAVAQRRAHPVERLRRRKRVLLGVMMSCASAPCCIVSMSLGIMVVGRILQGGSVIKFGLAFLIMREHLSGPAFGITGHRPRAGHVDSLAPVHLIIGNVIQITFLRLTVREKPRLLRGSKSSVLPRK